MMETTAVRGPLLVEGRCVWLALRCDARMDGGKTCAADCSMSDM